MLDWIYSNFFYIAGLYAVFIGVIIDRISNIYDSPLIHFASYICGIGALVGFLFFGEQSRSGYLDYKKVAYLGTHQKYLLIRDHTSITGWDAYPRFYWIDMENGQVLFREGVSYKNNGSIGLLSYSEKFIHYKNEDEINVLNIETGDVVEFSEDEVTTLLSNDNEGLNRYTFDPKNLTITLRDNKGKIYQDSLKALFPGATLPVTLEEDFTEYVRIGESLDLNSSIFKLQGGARKVLVGTDGKTLQPEQVFIEALFMRTYEVGTDTTANITVIHSYETLERATFIVSVLDETGHLLWEFKDSEADDLSLGSNAAFIFPYQDNLLFIIKDRLLSFHALTGKLNWEKRI